MKVSTQTLYDLIHEMKQDFKEDLLEIKEQTKKTNGRVNRLESKQDKQEGALAMVKLLIIPIALSIIMILIENYLI